MCVSCERMREQREMTEREERRAVCVCVCVCVEMCVGVCVRESRECVVLCERERARDGECVWRVSEGAVRECVLLV